MQVWPLQEEPPGATSDDDYDEHAQCRACGDWVAPHELNRAGICTGCQT